jgi:hypothetical protein
MARKKRISTEAKIGMTADMATLVQFAAESTETPASIWLRVAAAQRLHQEGWPQRYQQYLAAMAAANTHRGT